MTAISISLLSLSLSAHAEVQWSGFATIAAGMMTNSDDDYAGYEGTEIDWLQDSKVGLQATTDLQEGLTFTIQILATGADDFDTEIKWLYANYQVNDELAVKVGKVRAPIYKYSDYLDVGYTYHWIRPPVETYNLYVDTAEGIQFSYNNQLGDVDSSLTFLFGRLEDETTALGYTLDIDIDKLFVLSWDLAYENFTSRIAYAAGYGLTVDLSDVEDINTITTYLENSGYADYASTVDNILVEGDDAYFASIAFGYDNGDQFVMAEGTYQDTGDNLFSVIKSWYISSGFRVNSMTYHLTYANVISETPDFILDGVTDAYTTALVESRDGNTSSWTVGARYDFHPSAALKVQYTKVDDDDAPVSFGNGDQITAALDLVF